MLILSIIYFYAITVIANRFTGLLLIILFPPFHDTTPGTIRLLLLDFLLIHIRYINKIYF